jgi:hypothetical protein
MNYIPLVSLFLWISIVMGYIFVREIFILPVIIFPTLILLSIFLPVSFWTLQAKGKRFYSTVFVGIFFINNAVLAYGFFSNYATLNSLLEVTEKRIDPELAKLLVSGNSEKERSAVSRIIYQKHGVALPFMTQDDLFALHVPTQADKDIFIDNHEKSYLVVLKKQNLSNQIITTFFLLALQVTIFFTLLIFLILYDRSPQQARKKRQ